MIYGMKWMDPEYLKNFREYNERLLKNREDLEAEEAKAKGQSNE